MRIFSTVQVFGILISMAILTPAFAKSREEKCEAMVEVLTKKFGLESFNNPGSCAVKKATFNGSEVSYPSLSSGPKVEYDPRNQMLTITLAYDPVSGASIYYSFVFDSTCTQISRLNASGFLGRPSTSVSINPRNCAQLRLDEKSSDYETKSLAFTLRPICDTFKGMMTQTVGQGAPTRSDIRVSSDLHPAH